MRQLELFVDERSLFEKLIDQEYLKKGFKAVKKNGGSPGIDGVTVSEFERRLRSCFAGEQKRRRHLFKKLLNRNVSKRQAAKTVFASKGRWALSATFALHRAYPNKWFINHLGQKVRSEETHPHWFSIKQWVHVT